MPSYTFRFSEDEVATMDGLARRNAMTRTDLVRRAIDSYRSDEALLVDYLLNLYGAGRVAAFRVRGDEDGQPRVEGEVALDDGDAPFGASTSAPLEQHVALSARPERGGRAIVELVGHPHTDFVGIRLFVATVPLGHDDVTVTVKLLDLHPATREAIAQRLGQARAGN